MSMKISKAIESCNEKLFPLLDSLPNHVLVRGGFDPKKYAADNVTRQKLSFTANAIEQRARALIEIHNTIEEAATIHALCGLSPGRRKTSLLKSKYLHILWFAFENETYLFKEKTKLFFNKQKILNRAFDNSYQTKLSSVLKNIENEIGKHIRSRGSTVHDFNNYNRQILLLEIVELMHRENSIPPEAPGFADLNGHHSDVKHIVREDILRGIIAMSAIFRSDFAEEMDLLSLRLQCFNNFCEQLQRNTH